MDFKVPYVMAMREQAPEMFKRLRKTGAMESHLQKKSEEAHQLFEELTRDAPRTEDGFLMPAARKMAEEAVFAMMIEFPADNDLAEQQALGTLTL